MNCCSKAIVINKEQNYVLTKLILWYSNFRFQKKKKRLVEQWIVDNLPKNKADNIMKTTADSYIEEGFNKGIL